MKTSKLFAGILISLLWIPTSIYAENILTIERAVQLALEKDFLTKSYMQQSKAFEEYSVAADTWMDPKIKLGILSLPTDSLELDQEPMTQLIVGYQQNMPRGDINEYQSEHLKARSDEKKADVKLRQRMVEKNVSKAWLSVYLHEQSEKIIQKNKHLFKQQLNVSQSLYASGRSQQQDVLQAELELSLLDDQLQQVNSKIREARAVLSRWVGSEYSSLPLQMRPGLFGGSIQSGLKGLVDRLEEYPLITKYRAREKASRQQVELEKQKYSPQWGFDITYGKRSGENMDGSDRSDFVSAIVNFDLPVFTDRKQDRMLSAKKKQLLATRYAKQDVYLQTISQLEQVYVKWQQLGKRVDLYDHQVLQQAKQNAKAALNGYQSGVVSFFTLTRARSAELKSELQRLNLVVEQAKAYADIRYLVGRNIDE